MMFIARLVLLGSLGLVSTVLMAEDVNTVCESGESNYTQTHSYTVQVTKTRITKTSSGWWKRSKYKQVSYLATELRTNLTTVCCPGFVADEHGHCIKGCEGGTHGVNCTLNCTCPTNAFENCDRDTGECTCKHGYTGVNCTEECSSGFYGPYCEGRCSCVNNSTCDFRFGRCNCTHPGWYGTACEKECENDTFGVNCKEKCTCNANQSCDRETGNCTCKPGRIGTDCDEECSEGLFGEGCLQNCTCNINNIVHCEITAGRCECKPGYSGNNCEYDCQLGNFGDGCGLRCIDICNYTEYCDPSTGDCICIGRMGTNCSEDCNNGTFGVNCTGTCTCLDTESCDPIFGNCSCRPGLTGRLCDQESTALVQSSSPTVNVPVIVSVSILGCVIVIIVVICMCRRRRGTRAKGSQRCSSGDHREPSAHSVTEEVVENAAYIPLEAAATRVGDTRGTAESAFTNQTKTNQPHEEQYYENAQSGETAKETSDDACLYTEPDKHTTTIQRATSQEAANVYDTTVQHVTHYTPDTYNTFEQVRAQQANTDEDTEYNVLHEVKKPNDMTPNNYWTFQKVQNAAEGPLNELNSVASVNHEDVRIYGNLNEAVPQH